LANLPADVEVCPKCQTEISRDDEHPGTRLQSVADLRAELRAKRTPTLVQQKQAHGEDDAIPFRPVHRPPMAVVCMHYDGSTEGEEIAVRGQEFIIGRTDGDVTIPHDDQISSRHVKLLRRIENSRHKWIVQDLGSTNGTFALIEEGVLREGHELLLGSRRYRLDIAPQSDATDSDMPTKEHGQTGTWQSIASTSSSPSTPAPALVELKADGEGDRFEILGKETTIGTDDACDIVIEGDQFLSSRHARLWRDDRGRWMIKPIQAINGVWVRVGAIRLHRSGKFQIGEQRFSVRIP